MMRRMMDDESLALEAQVLADHAAMVGKVILVNTVTGFLGDTDDQVEDRPLDPPVAFIVDDMKPDDGLFHWGDDNWIDPYWDLTPVNADDPQISDMRSFWTWGPSYAIDGTLSQHSAFTPAQTDRAES